MDAGIHVVVVADNKEGVVDIEEEGDVAAGVTFLPLTSPVLLHLSSTGHKTHEAPPRYIMY